MSARKKNGNRKVLGATKASVGGRSGRASSELLTAGAIVQLEKLGAQLRMIAEGLVQMEERLNAKLQSNRDEMRVRFDRLERILRGEAS